MLDRQIGALECRSDVLDRYVAAVDAAHERMVWTHPGMSTYYRNEQGRVVVIYPFRNVDLFQATRHFSLDDFLAEPSHTSESDSAASADSASLLSRG
jgi:4-hydroxyacetophenone monooxygenase